MEKRDSSRVPEWFLDNREVRSRHRYGGILHTGLSWKDLAWINFKLSMMCWSLSMIIHASTGVRDALGHPWIDIWELMCLAGAAASVFGLVMGTRKADYLRKYGVMVELSGLCLMAVGPFIYWTTQLSIVITQSDPSWRQRLPITWFAWAMVCVVLARIVSVVPRYKRELDDMKKV